MGDLGFVDEADSTQDETVMASGFRPDGAQSLAIREFSVSVQVDKGEAKDFPTHFRVLELCNSYKVRLQPVNLLAE